MKAQSAQLLGITVSLLALDAGVANAQFAVLHSFTGGADGSNPYYGAPVISGSTLYGTADHGANSGGVVFSMNTAGGGFNVLHAFTGTAPDGYGPLGSVALSGSTLYGTTYYGGSAGGSGGNGAVFAVNVDGSGYRTVHSFDASDGYKPYGTVTVSGSTLYGTTYYSGSGVGSIYSVNTDGSDYTTLHSFAGGASDGSRPLGGALTLIGSTLYGTAVHGGTGYATPSADGVAFSIGTDGSGYNNLVNFTGGTTDGANPYGGLTLVGEKLYGMTRYGGSDGFGVIFSVNTNGTGYTTLYSFGGGTDDGANPNGGLAYDGSVLYGMTRAGGSANLGTVFEIQMDGTGFNLLHSFTGAADGSTPTGDLAFDNGVLYGWTSVGGANNYGTVFSLVVPEPSVLALGISGFGLLLFRRKR
jgi:uncharacterized repeat protein (TIGR03803 family)